jgi:hypothetical protein
VCHEHGKLDIGDRRWAALPSTSLGLLAIFLLLGLISPAEALPSFARQTGQPCGSCHTDYPGLTPYGRMFKLGGYTYGGGAYRTTPFKLFPSSGVTENGEQQKQWVPPISMMAIYDYTHVQNPQAAGIAPSPPYAPNDNTSLATLSFFWGGAVTDHIGAFSQVTYNPFAWHWDNTDIRYANTASIGSIPVIYGITANNNPTVQDPWNTTPAWSFPYQFSAFGAGYGSTPFIDGAFAQQVTGVGAYAYFNDLVYLEATVYHTLDPGTLNDLGVAATDTGVGRFDFAPYWRAAIEPHWGRNWLEFGTFGMSADMHPWDASATTPIALGSTDRYTDLGFDTQYQYQGDNYWLTLRSSYIHEWQQLDASFNNPLSLTSSSNPSDTLNEARAYASLAYGNDNRVVLTGQYFTSWGTPDATLYANNADFSPDTKGWVAEVAYIPFMESHAPGWPWFNARVGLQYTAYTEFAGTNVGASAFNTTYLYLWVAM